MPKELKRLEVWFDPKEQRKSLVHRLEKALEFLGPEPASECWLQIDIKDIAYMLSCIDMDEFLEDRYE